MGEIVHNVLWFDCFALDLTRGCLRLGDRHVELRPKAFEVLHHLAANAGVLVPKRDLFEAVWPNITVSDDSLVQCIRELRQKLGDHDHRLIKTVSRRGYLLDAKPTRPWHAEAGGPVSFVQSLLDRLAPERRDWQRQLMARLAALNLSTHTTRWRPLVAVSVVICAGAAGLYLFAPSAKPVGNGGGSLARYSVAPLVAYSSPPTFKDCHVCPEMVQLPSGEFMMGSPADEVGRRQTERPQRRVAISKRFALGRFEVTVDQFSAFVAETGFATGNVCRVAARYDGGSVVWSEPQASFLQPGFEVTGSHPVVCISGQEAQAYVAWLRRRTGRPYRLPTEAEWEFAARAGTTTSYSFGMDETELCAYARFADLSSPFGWRTACRSDAPAYGPIPVGMLKPNPWGLADMHGNAWEWVEDCWTPDVRKIPTDGSAFMQPSGCEVGVIRGGAFAASPRNVRSAHRRASIVAEHYQTVGFRVALSLDAP